MPELELETIEAGNEVEQQPVLEQAQGGLSAFITEKRGQIGQKIRQAIEKRQEIEAEIADIEKVEIPEATIESMQAAVGESNALNKKWENLTREDYLRIIILNRQIKKIPQPLEDSYLQFEKGLAAEQSKVRSMESQEYMSEAEAGRAQALLESHNKIWRPVRWVDRLVKREKIESAEKISSDYQALEMQVSESRQRITGLLDEESQLLSELKKVHDLANRRSYFISDEEAKKRIIQNEVIYPMKSEISVAVEQLADGVKAKLVEQIVEESIRPPVQTELIREEVTTLSEAEFAQMLVENARRYNIRNAIDYDQLGRKRSDEWCKILGLEPGSWSSLNYNQPTETFTVTDYEETVFKTFPLSEFDQYHLLSWNLKPGEKLDNGQAIENWDLAQQKLVLINANGERVVVQGVEDLIKWEAQAYYISKDEMTGEDSLALDESDPFRLRYSYEQSSIREYKIRSRENGQVTLVENKGNLTQAECDHIVEILTSFVQAEQVQKSNLSVQVFSNLQNRQYLEKFRALEEFCLRLDPRPFIRLLALAPLEETAHQNGLDATLDFGSEIWNAPHDLEHRTTDFCERYYPQFEYLINNPVLREFFPTECATVLNVVLEKARQKINTFGEDCFADCRLAIECGNSEDFYNAFSNLMLGNEYYIRGFKEIFQLHPDRIKAKIVAMGKTLPGAERLQEVMVKFSDDYNLKNIILREMAPVFRERIKAQDAPPEEKYRLIQILLGGRDSAEINPDILFGSDLDIKPEFVQAVMLYARTLPGIEEKLRPADINPEMIQDFMADFKELAQEIKNGKLEALRSIFTSFAVFGFLARHPESLKAVLQLPEQAPDFMTLISEGGALEDNQAQMVYYLFADGDVTSRAKSMVTIFAGNEPIDEKLIAFVEARLHTELQNAETLYPVKIMVEGEVQTVPYKELSYTDKIKVLHEMVKRSIEISRSTEAKNQASERNRQAPGQFQFKTGMYLHGLDANVLVPFIRNGNICGEALGPSAEKDSFPFQVDYSYIQPDAEMAGKSLTEVIQPLQANSRGNTHVEGGDAQVIAVTDRDQSTWEKGVTYFAGNIQGNHTLILGASPATELHAFILREPAASLPLLIQACVEEEHYIPGYALETKGDFQEGQMVFTYEDYTRALEERKPFQSAQEFLDNSSYLDAYDVAQVSGLHKFTLKNHLLLATEKAFEIGESYNLTPDEQTLVSLAARLHDIGKGAVGEQLVDNPVVAAGFLSQIRGLTPDQKELLLNLIRYDELLGDILQGTKNPEQFSRIFPDDRHQRMLLTLYKSDVQAIDGNEDGESLYHTWQVAEKLRELGLERS